jgi:DNA topoisomerase-1
MIIKEGRFGAYVTDGEINATLRRGDDVETITSERAAELLAEKRAKGPTPKKRPAKRSQAAAASTTSTPKPAAKRVAAKNVRAKAG